MFSGKFNLIKEVNNVEIKEGIKMKGKVRFELYDKDGNKKLDRTIENLILNNGKEIAAERLGGTGTQDYLQAIALGVNNTAPAVSQTDLQGAELGRVTTVNSYVVSFIERFIGTFGPGVGTGIIEEAVIADANAASGARKCFSRVITGTITKGAGDTMTVTWEVTFTAT